MGNKLFRFGLALVAILVIAVVVLYMWNTNEVDTGEPEVIEPRAQELRLAIPNDPSSLDPQFTGENMEAFIILNATLEGLVRLDEKGQALPGSGLAEFWDVNEEATEFTFYLREAYWDDGSPITALDFAHAWLRAIDPRNSVPYAYQFDVIKNAAYVNGLDPRKEDIDTALSAVGITVVDERTLKVELERPTAHFPLMTALPVYLPAQKEQTERWGNLYGSDVAKLSSSGPYTVAQWEKGRQVVLVRNEDYWDATNVTLEKIELTVIKDSYYPLQLFETGELDLVSIPKDVVEDSDYLLRGTTFYLSFNLGDPRFKNENIRRAFSAAIDRERFANEIVYSTAMPATRYVPLSFGLEDNELFSTTADVKEAEKYLKAGLKELGVDDIGEVILLGGESEASKRYTAALKEMFEEALDVEITVINGDLSTRIDVVRQGEYGMVLSGWSADYNDPLAFLEVWVSNGPFNDSNWHNEKYDELIAKARRESNPEKRKALLNEAEELIFSKNGYPFTPIYWQAEYYTYQEYVEGLIFYPVGPVLELKWVYVSED